MSILTFLVNKQTLKVREQILLFLPDYSVPSILSINFDCQQVTTIKAAIKLFENYINDNYVFNLIYFHKF